MLIPHRRTILLLIFWCGCAIAVSFNADWLWIWQLCGALLAAFLIADGLLAWRSLLPPEIERNVATSLPVGEWATVELKISKSRWALRGSILDGYPQAFEAQGLPQKFSVAANHWAKVSYRVRPLARGNHRFASAWLRVDSPLGLWQRSFRSGDESDTKVYPDFAKVTQYALMATENRLSQIGLLRRRRRGHGLDFHALREYRQGDTPKQIDWKATARYQKLISREYQDERDQSIVFLLDCGQRMRAYEKAAMGDERVLSHFDHTLNALLLLAYVALRQGDAVGVFTFAHNRPRYLAPRKSVSTVNRILNGLYDLEPTLATPDYLTASEELVERLKKRSLVILLTNLRDEDDDLLIPAVRLLQRRNLTLVANLREVSLDGVLHKPIGDLDDALTYGATAEYLRARTQTFMRLRNLGVQLIDAYPSQLPTVLVNRYWTMKRSGRL